MALSDLKCVTPKAGDTPLSSEQTDRIRREVQQWNLKDSAITREFKFKDFIEAMSFVNKVANLAQDEDHHPDIFISYNTVRLVFSTHKIGGLSRNDFIMAAKVDRLANA